MENNFWEDSRKEKIKVICRSEETALNFLNSAYKVGIGFHKWNGKETYFKENKNGYIIYEVGLLNNSIMCSYEKDIFTCCSFLGEKLYEWNFHDVK